MGYSSSELCSSSITTATTATSTATTMKKESIKDHVLLFPFMAKGHMLPLLHLTTALSIRGIATTFLTTPGNATFVSRHLRLPRPDVRLLTLPFPDSPSLPKGCENTDSMPSLDLYAPFLLATSLLRQPFQDLMHRLSASGSLPLCVVSDFYLHWTLPVCEELGVPRLVFHGMGVFATAVIKSFAIHQPNLRLAAGGRGGQMTAVFHVPGTPPEMRFARSDIPAMQWDVDPSLPLFQFLHESGESDDRSWGLLVNTFAAMEGDHVSFLKSFYRHADSKPWLVGPLSLYDDVGGGEPAGSVADDSGGRILEWLEGREPESVLYVSFGTQAHVADEQLDEIAWGLAASGCDFVWVVRSLSWAPLEGMMPPVPEEKGLIWRDWAPQNRVLSHPATGGFLSHCGWNSVLEGVAAGVPILAWPMIGEQAINAKYLAEELGVALRVPGVEKEAEVERSAVCGAVRELMGGEKGRKARATAKEMGAEAEAAVRRGGSSSDALDELVGKLRRVREAAGF